MAGFMFDNLSVIITTMGSPDASLQFLNNLNYTVILLAGAVVFYWIYVFITFYHLTRFGIGSYPKIFSLVFLAVSVVLFTVVVFLYARIDFAGVITKLKESGFFEILKLKL